MPSFNYIVLDSYPLGNAVIVPLKSRTISTHSEQCYQWLMDCEAAGKVMLGVAKK